MPLFVSRDDLTLPCVSHKAERAAGAPQPRVWFADFYRDRWEARPGWERQNWGPQPHLDFPELTFSATAELSPSPAWREKSGTDSATAGWAVGKGRLGPLTCDLSIWETGRRAVRSLLAWACKARGKVTDRSRRSTRPGSPGSLDSKWERSPAGSQARPLQILSLC